VSLLATQLRTLFILTSTGRIDCENDPDRSPGPRLWLAGCALANVAAVRSDVADEVAAEITGLAATEPAFTAVDTPPRYLDRYVDLLSRDAPVPQKTSGSIYELPHRMRFKSAVELIDGESQEGQRLEGHLSDHGMPYGLRELGFRSASDLWRPWCIVRVHDELVSVAFAARLSEIGAELGVATVKASRGRGYAAAAVAGWSRLSTLQSRKLFYSTEASNIASQRVIARLGLRHLGATLRLT
jgi:hypothetical protein